ncbi:MAG: WYL domain-containing protein [Acidobacteriaceae bacterium]
MVLKHILWMFVCLRLLGGEPQLVRIRFSPDQAPYVMERHWHDSERFIPQGDGGVIMEVQVGNLWEVKRWLIGWGEEAEALQPAGLRDEMGKTVSAMSSVYDGRDNS